MPNDKAKIEIHGAPEIQHHTIEKWGRTKFMIKGIKYYAALVSFDRRLRKLHRLHRTASETMQYTQRVIDRYRRLSDLAMLEVQK